MKYWKRWIAVTFSLGVLCFVFLIFKTQELRSSPYRVSVEKNQKFSTLAQKLEDDGVIVNAALMRLTASLTGADKTLKVGIYLFRTPVSIWTILSRISLGKPDQEKIQIIEGWTYKKIRSNFKKEENLKAVLTDLSESAVLEKIGIGAPNAEGQFLADTYFYTPGSTDEEVLRRSHSALKVALEEAWVSRNENLPYKTPYELLIMASLVEKETALAEDRKKVASVFVNRLRLGMRLQTDPTIIYGMGDQYNGKIRKVDILRPTPYNTYTIDGLPPTPIAMISLAALEAAAHPDETPYLYFVARGDGSSQFSATLNEHNNAVNKYIRGR
ncbi:MAG: endolytic transglycosylase MltG [Neisseriaceae bacterium]|nr:endolytic transglycosylase MltG [Neisseriaceae bacterium]